jgi:hypothetical protein
MPADVIPAPKAWRGRFYEDFEVGDVFRSRLGRTITDTDNIWFTCLTMNTNQSTSASVHGADAVRSTAREQHVHARSSSASASLSTTKTPPRISAETSGCPSRVRSAFLGGERDHVLRESRSNPGVGIVSMRCRGINQRREVVIEFDRTFMDYRREADEVRDTFPGTDTEWTVGGETP